MGILLDKAIYLTPELEIDSTEFVGTFPRGHVSIVAGEPGIGKTWYMLDFCRELINGGFLPGVYTRRCKSGRAMIFAGETGVKLLASRMRQLGGLLMPENLAIISLHVCGVNNIDVMLNTAIGRQNINDAIREFRPDVVFFDTMISFMGGGKDESSQADMSDTLRGLTFIASENNCALVVMHHFRKRQQGSVGENRSMDDVIGSSAFIRLASYVISIVTVNAIKYVKCLKSWWKHSPTYAFVIADSDSGVIVNKDYAVADEGHDVSRVVNAVAMRILEVFADTDFSLLDVCAECNVSRPTASEVISKLVNRGRIEQVGKDGNTRKYAVVRQMSINA